MVSYVASSPIASWSFSVLDFINDAKNRGAITNSWYLTSIQAGFEPWIGGTGLAVNSFSADRQRWRRNQTPPTTTPTTNPTTVVRRLPRQLQDNVWTGGFTADVTVANTGSGAINGWALGFTLPSGQAITSSWNAALTGSSGAVTARNVVLQRRHPGQREHVVRIPGHLQRAVSPARPHSRSTDRTAPKPDRDRLR